MIQGQSVMHYVTYPHSPQRVARALVDAEELALWLMPNKPGASDHIATRGAPGRRPATA